TAEISAARVVLTALPLPPVSAWVARLGVPDPFVFAAHLRGKTAIEHELGVKPVYVPPARPLGNDSQGKPLPMRVPNYVLTGRMGGSLNGSPLVEAELSKLGRSLCKWRFLFPLRRNGRSQSESSTLATTCAF